MTIAPLLERVDIDAAAEARRREAAAEDEARAAREATIARLEARRTQALAALTEAHAAERTRLLARAECDAMGRVLDAEHAVVDAVLARARRQFGAFARSPAYVEGLRRWLAHACDHLPPGAVEVRASPDAGDAARTAAGDGPDTTVVVDPTLEDGVIVRSADGRVQVDGTWRRAVERDRARLAISILQALAPDQEPRA